MILKPNCFARLYCMIAERQNCASANLALEDPIQGHIKGIHIYRTEAVRRFGFYPIEAKGPERRILAKLVSAGYEIVGSGHIGGQHHPDYLPHEAFYKYRFIGEKLRYYDNTAIESFEQHLKALYRYWQRTGDVIALYGMAGLFDGLQVEDISHPLDYSRRHNLPSFLRVQDFLERFSAE
jgi:hypothetical protein